MFALIGHNTRNILEVLQMFRDFAVGQYKPKVIRTIFNHYIDSSIVYRL